MRGKAQWSQKRLRYKSHFSLIDKRFYSLLHLLKIWVQTCLSDVICPSLLSVHNQTAAGQQLLRQTAETRGDHIAERLKLAARLTRFGFCKTHEIHIIHFCLHEETDSVYNSNRRFMTSLFTCEFSLSRRIKLQHTDQNYTCWNFALKVFQ